MLSADSLGFVEEHIDGMLLIGRLSSGISPGVMFAIIPIAWMDCLPSMVLG